MNRSSNRWALSFFFALVAFPFVAVFGATQGPRVLDALFPVYTIGGIDWIEETPTGMSLMGVRLDKHFSCRPEGLMYVVGRYHEAGLDGEVMFPAERGVSGKPMFVGQNPIHRGETLVVPEVRFIISKEMRAKIAEVHLLIPCERPFVGGTRALTNPVKIH